MIQIKNKIMKLDIKPDNSSSFTNWKMFGVQPLRLGTFEHLSSGVLSRLLTGLNICHPHHKNIANMAVVSFIGTPTWLSCLYGKIKDNWYKTLRTENSQTGLWQCYWPLFFPNIYLSSLLLTKVIKIQWLILISEHFPSAFTEWLCHFEDQTSFCSHIQNQGAHKLSLQCLTFHMGVKMRKVGSWLGKQWLCKS